MTSGNRVAVTGIGLVSPFGDDSIDDFFQSILSGKSAIRKYMTDDVPRGLSVPAVRCQAFKPERYLPRASLAMTDRYSQLALAAATQAWMHAGLEQDDEYEYPKGGVSWGSALGGIGVYEEGYKTLWLDNRDRVSPYSVVKGMNNAASAHIGIKFGLGGDCLTYSVACASGAIAIGEAYERIRRGHSDIMIAGGSDTPLSYAVVRAWEAMKVMAPIGEGEDTYDACRPFSKDRRGLVLAEGSAALILEDWDRACRRGVPILAEMVGYGTSSDHYHIVRPHIKGQTRALAHAMEQANFRPDEIDYINAHGTATLEGDAVEIQAIKSVFGDVSPKIKVSGTKSMHGHSMGAVGAIEAVITIMALVHDAVPPTAHLKHIDAACEGVNHIQQAIIGSGLKVALSNTFAFGGSNAVLAFKSTAADY